MATRKHAVLFLMLLAFFLLDGGCGSNSSNNNSSVSDKEIVEAIKEIEKKDAFPNEEQLARVKKLLKIEKVEISDANSALVHLAVLQLAKVTGYEINDRDGFNHSYIEERLASFKKFALKGGLDRKKVSNAINQVGNELLVKLAKSNNVKDADSLTDFMEKSATSDMIDEALDELFKKLEFEPRKNRRNKNLEVFPI